MPRVQNRREETAQYELRFGHNSDQVRLIVLCFVHILASDTDSRLSGILPTQGNSALSKRGLGQNGTPCDFRRPIIKFLTRDHESS